MNRLDKLAAIHRQSIDEQTWMAWIEDDKSMEWIESRDVKRSKAAPAAWSCRNDEANNESR